MRFSFNERKQKMLWELIEKIKELSSEQRAIEAFNFTESQAKSIDREFAKCRLTLLQALKRANIHDEMQSISDDDVNFKYGGNEDGFVRYIISLGQDEYDLMINHTREQFPPYTYKHFEKPPDYKYIPKVNDYYLSCYELHQK